MFAYTTLALIINIILNMLSIVVAFTVALPVATIMGTYGIAFIFPIFFIMGLVAEYFVNYGLSKWFYYSSDTLKSYKKQIKFSRLVLSILSLITIAMLIVYIVKSEPIVLGLNNSIFISIALMYPPFSLLHKVSFIVVYILLASVENITKYIALEKSFSTLTPEIKRPYQIKGQKLKNTFKRLSNKLNPTNLLNRIDGNIGLPVIAIVVINSIMSGICYFISSSIYALSNFFYVDVSNSVIAIVITLIILHMTITNVVVAWSIGNLSSDFDDFKERKRLVKSCFITFNVLSLITVVFVSFVDPSGYFLSNYAHSILVLLSNSYIDEFDILRITENPYLIRLFLFFALSIISLIENTIKTLTIKITLRN